MAAAPNGNIYAADQEGDIYMQTNGSGNFVALSQVHRFWRALAAAPNGNVYAATNDGGGSIYMQTNGSGNFDEILGNERGWMAMAASPNGNVYAAEDGGDIYMQSNSLIANNNLDITAGTLDLDTNDSGMTVTGVMTIDGTFSASNSNGFIVKNTLTNNGTFTHNSGTTVLAPSGSGITINGNNGITFNNLTLTAASGAGKTLQFKDGNTYIFDGEFNVAGDTTNILTLSSTTPGNQWFTTFNSSAEVANMYIRDSGCSGGNDIERTVSLTDLGNNGSCWRFFSRRGGGAGVESSSTPDSQTGGGSGGGADGGGTPETPASVHATISGNAVNAVIVDNGGGYSAIPSVNFCGGGGSGAQAAVGDVELDGGSGLIIIISIDVTNGGSNYTSAPTVIFNGQCGGSGGGAGGGDSGFLYGKNNFAFAYPSSFGISDFFGYFTQFLW
jgi:hypothetical protein